MKKRKKRKSIPIPKLNNNKSTIKKRKKRKVVTLNKKKPKRKLWKKLVSLLIFLGSVAVFAIFGFFLYIVASTEKFDPNALANQDQTVIYDSKNNVIAKLGIEKRESIKYEDLPQVLIDAIVATEDSRYFQHNGVDGARFLKASFGQIMGNSYAGGASTLTMQVVKNNLTSRDRNIIRKFKDIYLSIFIMEKNYSKEEILEFYVNDSLLGGNVYGVQEASKYYFNKNVSQLSLPEAALIAGLFQSPNGYNPYNKPENAAARIKTVLKLMVRHGYITQEEADVAGAIDIKSILNGSNEKTKYQGYVDAVIEEVEARTKNNPYLVSMEVHTALNPEIQKGLDNIMSGEAYNWPDEKVQAGVTVLDVTNGEINAIGAGRNRTGELTYNYATMAKRQPGSTAKPVFAYGPGMEYDNFSTYELFMDESWHYSDGTEFGNWDGGYNGMMTLKDAVAVSRNVPAVKALQRVNKEVGNDKIVKFVNDLGIKLENNVAYESYAIGGLSKGVTTVEMAGAYAAFANGGYYIEPHTIKSIKYRGTNETTDFNFKKQQAMKESTAYLMTNVLEYAAHHGFSGGTARYAGTKAVKTGTSNFSEDELRKHGLPSSAVKDLWSVAYTPKHAISLWYGYEKTSSSYYLTGASAPKDNLMTAVMSYIPVTNEEFKQPSSVVQASVEFGTWPPQKPSEFTPGDLVRNEFFASGSAPTEVSPRFAKLDDVKNLKATDSLTGVKITWDGNKPEVATDDYLNKYYSQVVFGNSSKSLIDARKDYTGDFGYGIYVNGREVAFTTDKSYTYRARTSGDVTIMVKAEYRKFKANASNGVTVKTKTTGTDSDDTGLNVSIVTSNPIFDIGKYAEAGVTVTFEGKKLSQNEYDIDYIFQNRTYSSSSELESAVNSITNQGYFTITYKVKYKDEEKTATRNITLKK
ncbi:MAG: transglycosylase domain-containing protein [Bacilli bacterium]|nr:transglycosylase domain-containing protein [Bacilli bacterium]